MAVNELLGVWENDPAFNFDFDMDMSKDVKDNGETGQQLITDGSGKTGWGGIPYTIFFDDNFNNGSLDAKRWTSTGTPTFASGYIELNADSITSIMPDVMSIKSFRQIKIEFDHYFSQYDNNNDTQMGLHDLLDDNWVRVYKSSGGAEKWWFSVSTNGNETREQITITGEVQATISIVVTERWAKCYVGSTLKSTLRTNIPKDNVNLKIYCNCTTGNVLRINQVRLKSLISVDAF